MPHALFQKFPSPSWSLSQLCSENLNRTPAPITVAELEKVSLSFDLHLVSFAQFLLQIAQLAGLSLPSESVASLHRNVARTIDWMGQVLTLFLLLEVVRARPFESSVRDSIK